MNNPYSVKGDGLYCLHLVVYHLGYKSAINRRDCFIDSHVSTHKKDGASHSNHVVEVSYSL
jgi:hypothetical protein